MLRKVLRTETVLRTHRTLCNFTVNRVGVTRPATVLVIQHPRPSYTVLTCRPTYTFIGVRSLTHCIDASDIKTHDIMETDLRVFEDFITEEEEESLLEEVEPHLKRLRYEKGHWDDAIQGFRETEKKNWREKNKIVLQRLKETALPDQETPIAFVHVLDLAEDGVIKPHIDSVRFCGSAIAGLSLLSPSIMRFVHEKDKSSSADVLLKRRSLYIIKGRVRFDYTHEILSNEDSKFRGEIVPKGRRISVICRTEPNPTISPT